ncbi:MAG TPA: sensor domain-containing protein, partial [Pilimelia sp.]|nr:sensor domain-containing protein [Pilimelia sp.]
GDAGSPVRTAGPAIIRPLPQGPVPPAAMLQPVDVGRGEYGVFDHVGRSGSGDWRMPLNQTNCAPNIDARPRAVLAHHERSLVNENAPDKTLVTERVVRFATAGEARRHLDDVQAMVRACLGDGVFLSVVVHDFAGPGSMVVRSMADADTKTLHVWVRRGNLVAEVWAKSMPTDQQAVRLGERAAARLCVGTIC